MPQAPLHRAETLDTFYKNLDPEPLVSQVEVDAFYYQNLNRARGQDNVPAIQRELQRSWGGRYFRAFLAGHSGCGKSTELTRLVRAVEGQFRSIRFSAKQEMHASAAKAFDVPLVMMARLAEQIAKPEVEGGLAWTPPNDLTRSVLAWFDAVTITSKNGTNIDASVSAGVGIDPDTLWGMALGLFAKFRAEARFSSERRQEVVERRIARLPDLINLLNDFFDACNHELRNRHGQEWLVIGEDFEKLLNKSLPADFFVRESGIFSPLRTHLIFTIPVDLAWSGNRVDLPFDVYSIQDTPVYTADFQPDKGRAALRELLAKRINPDLFDPGQLDRLIVASGGHLRDLFYLVRDASDRALDEPTDRVRAGHVSTAIAKLRKDVLLRLGPSQYDLEPVTWEERAKRLVAIHRRTPEAGVPDPILHTLLRARAVQEFNGIGRFAVAPLVVDILIAHGLLEKGAPGGLLPEAG